MKAEQNELRNVGWNVVRTIEDSDLCLFEEAVECLLRPHEAGHRSYFVARQFAERHNPKFGTGLIPESAPMVEAIVEFWLKGRELPPPPAPRAPGKAAVAKLLTPRQGQFLAFIHVYWILHRRSPSRHEIGKYFGVAPPTVQAMVDKLHGLGAITHAPGEARDLRVTLPPTLVPELDPVAGPPW